MENITVYIKVQKINRISKEDISKDFFRDPCKRGSKQNIYATEKVQEGKRKMNCNVV